MRRTVPAYRVAWRTEHMPASAFLYYRSRIQADDAVARLRRDGTVVVGPIRTRVPATFPCLDED